MRILHDFMLLCRKVKEERSVSLQLRLFAFLVLLTVVLASTFLLIMMLSGVFDRGTKESRLWMETELSHVATTMQEDFGKLSLQGVSLSAELSEEIERFLKDTSSDWNDLVDDPEQMEALLSTQMPFLLSMLTHNQCSGSFVVLDLEVSGDQGAQPRAGIFLKRTEPNTVSLISSKIHYLRGPADIARQNGVELMGQWKMGFDVSDADYYAGTMKMAQLNPELPLSRLYWWSGRLTLEDNSESGLLLCVPLRGSNGDVLGICGMEISSMLFKLQYSPDNPRYPRALSALAPWESGGLDTNRGLIAGNSFLTNSELGGLRTAEDIRSGLMSYRTGDGTDYVGLAQTVRLYPTDSPYTEEGWQAAVLMPGEDFAAVVRGNNRILYSAVGGAVLLGSLLAFLFSRYSIRPVVRTLQKIRTEGYGAVEKTNIAEIDDLLEYLSALDAEREQHSVTETVHAKQEGSGVESTTPDLSAYDEFVRNIKSLSTAEMAVFKLYMEGHTAKEIESLLCISMNTIKTHNKRIYGKLNVTSRKELMVYVQMMSGEKNEPKPH